MVTVTVATTNGQQTVLSLPDPVVNTSTRGLITAFNPATDNWGDPDAFKIEDKQFFVETANKAWSIKKIDDFTLEFEIRPGDLWQDDGTSRSEVLTVKNQEDDAVFRAEYGFMLMPGTVDQTLSWLTVGQMHEDGGIPFSISVLKDRMTVLTDQNADWGTLAYEDPNLIERGRRYAMKIEAKFSNTPNGYLKMWRDGVQIVNYTGRLGSETNGQYFKIGAYQGWDTEVDQVIQVRYDHIALDFTDPPPPPPPPPLPPGINKVGVTDIAPTVDDGNAGEILGQKVVLSTAATIQSLSFYLGTAAGNIRLGLYLDNNGRPSTKVTETASSAATAGWNTKPVLSQTLLQPGTYWLVFELSSNSALSRLTGTGTGIWNGNQTYGTLPATFPGNQPTFNNSWSFYMTVNV